MGGTGKGARGQGTSPAESAAAGGAGEGSVLPTRVALSAGRGGVGTGWGGRGRGPPAHAAPVDARASKTDHLGRPCPRPRRAAGPRSRWPPPVWSSATRTAATSRPPSCPWLRTLPGTRCGAAARGGAQRTRRRGDATRWDMGDGRMQQGRAGTPWEGGREGGGASRQPQEGAEVRRRPGHTCRRRPSCEPRMQAFQGVVLSAFFFGYAGTQVLGGEAAVAATTTRPGWLRGGGRRGWGSPVCVAGAAVIAGGSMGAGGED